MTQTSTAAAIRGFIRETFFVDELNDDDSFLQTGAIDSTGMLDLITFVEERFALSLEEPELVPANLDSVSKLVAFIDRKCTPTGTG